MENKINIRLAVPADLDKLAELYIIFEEHFNMLDGTQNPIVSQKEKIQELTFSDNPLLRTLVAELNGRIIGAISFYKGIAWEMDACYHLPYFAVHPEFRGGRAAMLLMQEVKKFAIREKIKSFTFDVYGKNKTARRLYEHIGAKYWIDRDAHFMYLDL
ncbi:MAG: GNAT family N-acetyltransferase [Alphaproteobacteria bacterium]|nr:GNAT family N-acetyltransferase [Alphaproteobacteria bacterium]